jgi:hypothetical protein
MSAAEKTEKKQTRMQTMKNIIKFKTLCVTATAVFGFSVAGAQAQVISWNLDVYGTIGSGQHAGVVDAYHWNDTWLLDGNASSATENNLMDNTGAATPLSLTEIGTGNFWNFNPIQGSDPGADADGSSNKRLLNGYINEGGGSLSGVTLSSIPYSMYDLYVYFSADTAERAGTVTVGSTTYDFSTVGSAGISGANASFIQTTDTTGANPTSDYAVFSNLTGSTQTIESDINSWGGIAGFQIVATPEPGTLALASMGGLAVLLLKRRSQKN